jgi:serine/threonine protein kinase
VIATAAGWHHGPPEEPPVPDISSTWSEERIDDEPTAEQVTVPADLVPTGYRIGRQLGAGGQARVYALDAIRGNPPLALKVVAADHGPASARFDREVDLLGRVRHPNLVSLVDVRRAPHASGLVMERLDGVPLRDWLDRADPPIADRLRVFRQVVGAVGVLHTVDAIHRDLKPGNVLVEERADGPLATLIDLGVAKSPYLEGITLQGTMLGTPGFLAPEQVREASTVDHRADLFALGCLLHLLIAGRPPSDGPNPIAVLGAVSLGHREPLQAAAPHAPTWLVSLVDALLDPDPTRRPATTAAVKAWLDAQGPPGD